MAYAISLYDALVSINVPKPQALAVVESLEQTMTSELATKTDLDQLRSHTGREFALLRGDIEREFAAVRQEIHHLRGDMEREFVAVRQEIHHLRGDMEREFVAVRQEIHHLRGDMEREFVAVRRDMATEFALVREELKSAVSRGVIMTAGLMIAWTSLVVAGLQFLS